MILMLLTFIVLPLTMESFLYKCTIYFASNVNFDEYSCFNIKYCTFFLQEFDEFFDEILNVTGFNWYYNYLFDQPINEGPFDLFVQQETIRSQINVGNITFDDGFTAAVKLSDDIYQSVKPWLEILLENYRTLLYSGQLDIIVPYPTTDNFLQTTQWSAADEFKNSTRYLWKTGDDLAGYSKTAGKLTLVLVRNAGHIVPEDQPRFAFDLISRFVSNIPFNE